MVTYNFTNSPKELNSYSIESSQRWDTVKYFQFRRVQYPQLFMKNFIYPYIMLNQRAYKKPGNLIYFRNRSSILFGGTNFVSQITNKINILTLNIRFSSDDRFNNKKPRDFIHPLLLTPKTIDRSV